MDILALAPNCAHALRAATEEEVVGLNDLNYNPSPFLTMTIRLSKEKDDLLLLLSHISPLINRDVTDDANDKHLDAIEDLLRNKAGCSDIKAAWMTRFIDDGFYDCGASVSSEVVDIGKGLTVQTRDEAYLLAVLVHP
jgi:hypothetical protein